MEDQVAEEQKMALDEMMKYGIFQPTETVEVINPINGECPNDTMVLICAHYGFIVDSCFVLWDRKRRGEMLQ